MFLPGRIDKVSDFCKNPLIRYGHFSVILGDLGKIGKNQGKWSILGDSEQGVQFAKNGYRI